MNAHTCYKKAVRRSADNTAPDLSNQRPELEERLMASSHGTPPRTPLQDGIFSRESFAFQAVDFG